MALAVMRVDSMRDAPSGNFYSAKNYLEKK
jgi:hypothetical protein